MENGLGNQNRLKTPCHEIHVVFLVPCITVFCDQNSPFGPGILFLEIQHEDIYTRIAMLVSGCFASYILKVCLVEMIMFFPPLSGILKSFHHSLRMVVQDSLQTEPQCSGW